MNVENLRTLVNSFYNNYHNDMVDFYNYPIRCRVWLIMRGLSDDLTIENNIHRIVSVTINRINQFSEELEEVNRRFINIPNNRWTNFYNNARQFIRSVNVITGLILIDRGEINIMNDEIRFILNQIGVNFNDNINDNINNNINPIH